MKGKAKSKVNEITRLDLGNFTSPHYGKANLTLSAPHPRGFVGLPMKIRPRFAAEGRYHRGADYE
jgi:hypothetical protein